MARQARGKSMDPAKVQVFHTVQRCVRRAFLCGEDTVSGKSYDHRKQWIRERLEFLASIFAIDLLTYSETVGDNHAAGYKIITCFDFIGYRKHLGTHKPGAILPSLKPFSLERFLLLRQIVVNCFNSKEINSVHLIA